MACWWCWCLAARVCSDLEGRFDTVLCLNVLEYLDDPGSVLDSLRSTLKPNGVLVVLVPCGPRLFRSGRPLRYGLVSECARVSGRPRQRARFSALHPEAEWRAGGAGALRPAFVPIWKAASIRSCV